MVASKSFRQQIRATLAGTFDSVSFRDGKWTVRESFFYKHGRTAERVVRTVQRLVPSAIVLDSGEVFKAFSGGQSVARGSHFYVVFTVADPAEPQR